MSDDRSAAEKAADGLSNERDQLNALIGELLAKNDAMRQFLVWRGYRPCDIAACNCGSWHGGHASERLAEIRQELEDAGIDTNGKTILHALRGALADVGCACGDPAEPGIKHGRQKCSITAAKEST